MTASKEKHGSTVFDVSFYRALNDSGEIAFFAKLADGREAIVRATVPEPATLALVPAGLAGFAAMRRRRTKA